MLIRFSVILGGNELVAYTPEEQQKDGFDPDLFSGMMEALQLLSEEIGTPIQQIQFGSNFLYIRTYGDFTIRLLLEEKWDSKQLDNLFNSLSKETFQIMPSLKAGIVIPPDVIQKHFVPLLKPVLQNTPVIAPFHTSFDEIPLPKMAIVGLASVGKTTIKNMFIEKMPAGMARNTSPTLGVDVSRKFSDFLANKMFVADFGGQKMLRAQHLGQINLWQDISILIFVVDVQDTDDLPEAKKYLDDVWQVISKVNPKKPALSIFLHKYDKSKRKKLAKNVSKYIAAFRNFVGFASFYLTTIDDGSCNQALIQSLYFALPDLMLKRLLEQEFLTHFENDVLPRFSKLVPDTSRGIPINLRNELRNSGIMFGRTYGMGLQESWMKYLTGNYTPPVQKLSSNSLSVNRNGPLFLVTISNYRDCGYCPELATTLLDGILEGISGTLRLPPPKIVKEDKTTVTWQIGMEKPL